MTLSASVSASPDVHDYDMGTILTEASTIRQTIIADTKHVLVFERELDRLLTQLGGPEQARDIVLHYGIEPHDFPSHVRIAETRVGNGRIFDVDDLPLLRRAARDHRVTPHLELLMGAARGVRGRLSTLLENLHGLMGMNREDPRRDD